MRRFLLLLAVAAAVWLPTQVQAQQGPVNPTTFLWDAPQTNADGSNLTDLGGYRAEVYPGLTPSGAPLSSVSVAAPNADPLVGETGSTPVAGFNLTVDGQYSARVIAIDTALNESVPSAAVPFSRNFSSPAAPPNPRFVQ